MHQRLGFSPCKRLILSYLLLGWMPGGMPDPARATADTNVVPAQTWQRVDSEDLGADRKLLGQARARALEGGGSGMIVVGGKQLLVWGDPKQKYDLKSTSKSIGVTALGLALQDGHLQLEDRAVKFHPAIGVPPEDEQQLDWRTRITIAQLASQTAGFDKPGGFEPLLFEPGSAWFYSDGGPNWLAECLTLVYQRDMESLLFERVFSHLGIQPSDLHWRSNQYRPPKLQGLKRCEFGSGVHANVDAMARIGLLYLRRGQWQQNALLPADFVDRVRSVPASNQGLEVYSKGQAEHADRSAGWSSRAYGAASSHYGLLWWNNRDGALGNVPRDAYWAWGLHDSLIFVVPSLDLVVARAGGAWSREDDASHYAVLAPFLEPIVTALGKAKSEPAVQAPYPPSARIKQIHWQPAAEMLQLAEGGDNWPITWADDNQLYTAYGDGWGFEPKLKQKLSMGLASVRGDPGSTLAGTNLRSTVEQLGQGRHGQKASGLLCLQGTLYMWLRNAGPSQLLWSEDKGKTWTRATWKFDFGCPTFLNAGRDYQDAQDEYVYVYSHDSQSAYDAADRMVLARVRSDRLRLPQHYEYFAGWQQGEPQWTLELEERRAVFDHPGRCYRSGITYIRQLDRYLWCQILPDSLDPRGPRFEGGFGIYDSPTPWGPWSTVFFTEHWDVGPGESGSVPCKWVRADGLQAYYLSSSQDCFSVRRLELELFPQEKIQDPSNAECR